MIYLKVHWNHDSEIQPVAFYSEMEDDRMEVRKVELFADGSLGFANEQQSSGRTLLGALPMPTLEELAAGPHYEAQEITGDEFEEIWRLACWE